VTKRVASENLEQLRFKLSYSTERTGAPRDMAEGYFGTLVVAYRGNGVTLRGTQIPAVHSGTCRSGTCRPGSVFSIQ
jgi:hypothetical protein